MPGRKQAAVGSAKPDDFAIDGYDTKILELSCDGTNYYFRDSMEGPNAVPGMVIQELQMATDSFRNFGPSYSLWKSDYWKEIGFSIPKQPAAFLARTPLQSEVLLLASADGGDVSYSVFQNGDKSWARVAIRSQAGETTFVLDPTLQYAVRRREDRSTEGKVLRAVECSEFVQLGERASVWLPRRCEVSHFQWAESKRPSPPSATPVITETFVITRIDNAPIADDSFVLTATEAGTAVSDSRLENAKDSPDKMGHYVVPAAPNKFDEAIAEAERNGSRGRGSWFVWTLVAVNAAIVVAVCIFLIKRRMRK